MDIDIFELGLSPKENGLVYGSFLFAIFYFMSATLIGQHAHKESADRKLANHNRKMAWALTFLGVMMMWMFWACVYMAQMYPLYRPIMAENPHAKSKHWLLRLILKQQIFFTFDQALFLQYFCHELGLMLHWHEFILVLKFFLFLINLMNFLHVGLVLQFFFRLHKFV